MAQELGALFLVTLIADFRLGFHRQHRVVFCMQIVAVHAGVFLDIMDAALPMKPGGVTVAGQTGIILVFDGSFFIKCDQWRQAAAIRLLFGMVFTRAVAGFTVVVTLCEW